MSAEPAVERWAYAGLRVLSGKRVHAWVSDAGHGEELLYTLTGTYAVGEVYEARVTRTDDRVTLHGAPTYAGHGRVDTDLAARWHAEDTAARTRLASAPMERAAARRSELDDLLEPLRVISAQLPTRADRTALIAYVLAELSYPAPGHRVRGSR
ncbi:MAG TPA: hypothetical protein VNV66_07905 [Pilimelia sp.]|nr:hypothetical protein [Pilimelia sp.]